MTRDPIIALCPQCEGRQPDRCSVCGKPSRLDRALSAWAFGAAVSIVTTVLIGLANRP